MNIPAHLASQLLETDFENVCAKLKAGGTLTTAERAFLQKCAASQAPAGHPAPAASDAPPIVLTALPSPANGDGRATREQLAEWTVTYGIEHRQLRRLIARGKEKNDPCPLDDPARMPAWVEKHVEKIRADFWSNVCAAAAAATASAPIAAVPVASVPPPPSGGHTSGETLGPAIDLALVGGVEGESVTIFRQLFAAARQELEEAYRGGSEEKKRTLHGRIEKIGESLRKHEAAAEAKAKRRGELLSRPEVYTAIAEALSVLRLMRESRKKRLLARLTTLTPDVADQLAIALDEIGAREEAVLANLPIIKTEDDLLNRLAA
jgi:hypothetical protein